MGKCPMEFLTMITEATKEIFQDDALLMKMQQHEVYEEALKLTSEAFKSNDVKKSIESKFDEIKNPEHWKNPAFKFTDNRKEAVLCVAAFIFYHGGVHVSSTRDCKTWLAKSEGYYHYCG